MDAGQTGAVPPSLPHVRRIAALGIALAVAAGACSEGTALRSASLEATSAPIATTTTSTTSTTSTTTIPPTTIPPTTTIPPQPGLTAVRTPSGILGLWYGDEGEAGYLVSTPCDRRTVVPRTGSTIVQGIDVLLDPGHGGIDPGATASNGMTEAELNLDVALRVAALLRAQGFQVELTRDDDYFRTIGDRAQLAMAIGPKAFVSIHHNGGIDFPVRGAIGSEIYYQVADESSRRLGGLVYESLEHELGALDAAWTRSSRWGVRARTNREGTDFYGVLRRSVGIPAVLIEGAYMTNAREAALLATAQFRAAEAAAIATGITRWLTSSDDGTGYQRDFMEDGVGGATDLRSCRDPRLDQPR